MACDYNFWLQFFRGAGILSDYDSVYATAFSENRIKSDMLLELDKTMLGEMGIIAIGDKFAIIRHALLVTERLKLIQLGVIEEEEAIEEHNMESSHEQEGAPVNISLQSSAVQKTSPDPFDSSSYEDAFPKVETAFPQMEEVKSSKPASSSIAQTSTPPNVDSVEHEICEPTEIKFKRLRRWDSPPPTPTKSSPKTPLTEEPPPERVRRVFLFGPPKPNHSPVKTRFREEFRSYPIPNPEFSSSVDDPIVSDNVGFKMLKRMGWNTGKSLGTNGGLLVPLRFKVRDKRMGLGANTFTMQDQRAKRFVNFISSGILPSTLNPPDS